MIQNVSSGAASVAALNSANAKSAAAANQNTATTQETTVTKKAVPSIAELNAQAFLQRQQIGAALYDRSFTLKEGSRALTRQDAIQAYAEQIQMKEGGPTAKDLRILQRKLDRAAAQIDRLSNNGAGINLSSVAGIDGRDIDIVQENLTARINAGIKDGSLTDDEAKVLVAQQDEIAGIEAKLRETDGKLTAGEMKQVMDQLRKAADAINQARNNGTGVNLGTYDYANSVNDRQAALEKQLDQAIKLGSITAEEADAVRTQFDAVNKLEEQALANGNVNWRESVGLSTAMNNAEIMLYDLQRNDAGVKLADSYVDVKYVDQRQAQQLESVTRGIDKGTVTNEEGIVLLNDLQATQALENKLVSGGLTRAEYLQLQNEMNDFSLLNADLQGNKDRYTGLFPAAPAPAPTTAPATGSGSTSGSTAPTTGTTDPGAAASGGSSSGTTASTASSGSSTSSSSSSGTVTNEAAAPTTVKVEAKPESVAEQEQAEVKAETAPTVPQINAELSDTKNTFGDLMTKMMRDRTDDVRNSHEAFLDKADQRRHEAAEKSARDDNNRSGTDLFGLPARDADREAKVASYAAVAKSGEAPAPVIAKKVA